MPLRSATALFILIFLLAPAKLFAVTVIFASPEDLPPKVYTENGELKGTYIEIIREACRRLNVEPEFQFYPWARAMALVKSGKVDAIFPPLKTPERSEFLYFPDEPMSITRNVIFAPKKRHLVVRSLEDLRELVIGVNDQYSYGGKFDEIKKSLNLDMSLNEEMQINKLSHDSTRRLDVAAGSEEAFKFMSRRLNVRQDFEVIYVLSENPSYVAFSRAKGPSAKELSKNFSKVLHQMKKEGVVQKITDKYTQ